MASGHVNRTKRPNTWAHRPMLHAGKKLLPTRSRPHMREKEFKRWGLCAHVAKRQDKTPFVCAAAT
jgi:hypothetical protein